MKLLDLAEVSEWLRSRGWSIGEEGVEAPGVVDAPVYELPTSPSGRLSVARAVVRRLQRDSEVLVWVHEYGIWPNSEHKPLFDRFRASFGDGRAVWEAPGHLFSDAEQADMTSLLALVMYFSWGAFVVAPEAKLAAVFSHHDSLGLLLTGQPKENSVAKLEFDAVLKRA